MARCVNRVTLMGNLTRDVETKFTPANTAVGNFGMALNREWKTPNGETKEEVTFVDCEVWGKGAEILSKFVRKGSRLYVEGRLKLDTWKDKTDGSNRSKLKIVVEDFSFIDSPRSGGPGGPGGGGESHSEYDGGEPGGYSSAPEPVVRTNRGAPAPAAPLGDADIPF
jgi:single-strand DNA-binding protein